MKNMFRLIQIELFYKLIQFDIFKIEPQQVPQFLLGV